MSDHTYSYIVTTNTITIVRDHTDHIALDQSHTQYETCLDLIMDGCIEQAFDVAKQSDLRADLEKSADETVKTLLPEANITLQHGVIYAGETPVHNTLADRIIEMHARGYSDTVTRMCRFLNRLMRNPSYRAVNGLYTFLEASEIPINENGTILAFKKVRENYTDIHSGTYDNSVGRLVEIERQAVDEDPDEPCSAGLHVCSYSYLDSYGRGPANRVVVVNVDPEDVVAIPKSDHAKMRVSRYVVVDEIKELHSDEEEQYRQYMENLSFFLYGYGDDIEETDADDDVIHEFDEQEDTPILSWKTPELFEAGKLYNCRESHCTDFTVGAFYSCFLVDGLKTFMSNSGSLIPVVRLGFHVSFIPVSHE